MIDSQSTTQEELQAQAAFVAKAVKGLGYRRIVLATADPSYIGGNPKVIMDVEDDGGAAPDEALPVIMPLAHTNAKPSGILVVMEVAPGEFVVVGEVGDLPVGKLTDGGYWPIVTPGSIAVSSTAITSRAQRLYCPMNLLVENVMFECTVGGAGLTARVKLYSADETLIIDTGAVNCDSAGDKNADIDPPIRITPGTYIVEATASVGISWRCADLMAGLAAVMNIGTTQRATDHTMGTATTAVQFPLIKYQS
jgi:hypothetical protein